MNQNKDIDISIVVPIGIGEKRWSNLLDHLNFITEQVECLFICASTEEEENIQLKIQQYQNLASKTNFHIYKTIPGRANQLNFGASKACGRYLWFIHCDTVVSNLHFQKLKEICSTGQKGIFYFHLKFYNEEPNSILSKFNLMKINEMGVRTRCSLFNLPFGDQTFFMPKEIFSQLGSFKTDAAYGEDHLLIWKAKQSQISIRALSPEVSTSSKKYSQNGWLKTTLTHLILTYKQAFPEFCQLIKLQNKND